MLPTIDHFSELSPPIADMIVSNHVVPEEPGDLRQGVPEYRRSDMAYMHRFRDIGRTEVDDDRFWLSRPFDAKAGIQSKLVKTKGEKFRRKLEIDESWAGHFGWQPNIAH